MKKILAKSSGILLIDHSTLVSRFAHAIASNALLEKDEKLLNAIRIAGLTHDIGKCTAAFQKKLNKFVVGEDEDNIEYKLPYRHNEVGWSFLSRNLEVDPYTLELVLDAVYWHHGISNPMGSYNDTNIQPSPEDEERMLDFLKSVMPIENIVDKEYKPKKAPYFYTSQGDNPTEVNMYKSFVRMCIISADRLISANDKIDYTDDEILETIEQSNTREKHITIYNHHYHGNDRFIKQQQIVEDTSRTTVIKGPAGFGKTLLGLLWSFRSNKKVIWVLPRNGIAEVMYKVIIEELEAFKSKDVSVELYLSGEVKKCNNPALKPFSSDIIVTNIDNFLSPTIKSRNASRLHAIIDCDVIFDEFHELSGPNPMFSCFCNIMRIRNMLTKSNTLLLSATPTVMSFLWDSLGQKTLTLPDADSHYPAAHDSKYELIVGDHLKKSNKSQSLILNNSISNAQYNKEPDNILIHSGFSDADKLLLYNQIVYHYGKDGVRSSDSPDVNSTPVIQASLDISLNHLFEDVLSPEATLQRIGRCDRWGDYTEQPTINITLNKNSSDNKAKEIFYSKNLTNLWYEYLQLFDGQFLTLNEFYKIYNSFNKTHEKVLKRLLIDQHCKSLEGLSGIYPEKYLSNPKTKIITAGGNKLRSSNKEIFVIYPLYEDNTKFSEPFSIQLYTNNFTDEFHEDNKAFKKIIQVMRSLRDCDDNRFDFNEMLNNPKITLDSIRQNSKKINTPYIAFNKVYHKSLGLISEVKLNLILEREVKNKCQWVINN